MELELPKKRHWNAKKKKEKKTPRLVAEFLPIRHCFALSHAENRFMAISQDIREPFSRLRYQD
jgi:hypothetical protein